MDPQVKKQALRMFTYGLYVLTCRKGSENHAATITWVSQVSFTPPMISVCLENQSMAFSFTKEDKTFALNILGKGQKEIAAKFFKHPQTEANKIGGIEFETKTTGAPLLIPAPAFLECKIIHMVPAGDHTIVVAEIIEAGVRRQEESLVLATTGWSYGG